MPKMYTEQLLRKQKTSLPFPSSKFRSTAVHETSLRTTWGTELKWIIIQGFRVEDCASVNDATRDWFNWILFMFSSVPLWFPNLPKSPETISYYQPQVWLLHSDSDAHFSSKFGQIIFMITKLSNSNQFCYYKAILKTLIISLWIK